MGPKVFQLPVLLALAYLGIGYVAWIMGLLILGYVDKPIRGRAIVYLPLVASSIMTAWDVAMEPAWSTLDHAWIWSYGGAYFGVPVSNFLGWLLTSYCFYQAFALYCRGNPVQPASSHRRFWFSAVLIYAVCAMGNLLLLKMPMAPAIVEDATGKPWLTEDILTCCVIVSLLLMVPCALLAWLRARHASVVLIVGHSTFAE
jgi:putative membrane protein